MVSRISKDFQIFKAYQDFQSLSRFSKLIKIFNGFRIFPEIFKNFSRLQDIVRFGDFLWFSGFPKIFQIFKAYQDFQRFYTISLRTSTNFEIFINSQKIFSNLHISCGDFWDFADF